MFLRLLIGGDFVDLILYVFLSMVSKKTKLKIGRTVDNLLGSKFRDWRMRRQAVKGVRKLNKQYKKYQKIEDAAIQNVRALQRRVAKPPPPRITSKPPRLNTNITPSVPQRPSGPPSFPKRTVAPPLPPRRVSAPARAPAVPPRRPVPPPLPPRRKSAPPPTVPLRPSFVGRQRTSVPEMKAPTRAPPPPPKTQMRPPPVPAKAMSR